MNKPRKHHFVPECYLNQFGSNSKLYCSNLEILKTQKKKNNPLRNSGQICYDINFYTINEPLEYNLNEFDELHVESKVLNSSENKYKKIINKLLEQKELNLNESIFLSDFIIQLKQRNPYYLKNSEKNLKSTSEKAKANMFNKLKDNIRFKHMPPALLRYEIEKEMYKIKSRSNIVRSAQLKGIIEKSDHESKSIERFREAILNCQFTLLNSSDSDMSFITSDNPGYSISNNGNLENTKFKDGFTYYLPLTSKYCLKFSDNCFDNFYSNKSESKQLISKKVENKEVEFININSSRLVNKIIISDCLETIIQVQNSILSL